jgi:hypothetical protein
LSSNQPKEKVTATKLFNEKLEGLIEKLKIKEISVKSFLLALAK